MNAEMLLYHLRELGVAVTLSPDVRSLVLEATVKVLTPELTELLREHKEDLIELIFVQEEADAIAWEGCRDAKGRLVVFEDKTPRKLARDDDRDEYGREVLGNIPQSTTPYAGGF